LVEMTWALIMHVTIYFSYFAAPTIQVILDSTMGPIRSANVGPYWYNLWTFASFLSLVICWNYFGVLVYVV
jgi:hypothetical protein